MPEPGAGAGRVLGLCMPGQDGSPRAQLTSAIRERIVAQERADDLRRVGVPWFWSQVTQAALQHQLAAGADA